MSSTSTPPLAETSAGAISGPRSIADTVALPPATLDAAHRAVETILSDVHELRDAGHATLTMRLPVGDENVSIHIALRGGEVQATFRSDSAEVRAALAVEWRGATARDAASPLHLASPVFAGNDSSNLSFNDRSPRQQPQPDLPQGRAAEYFRPGDPRPVAPAPAVTGPDARATTMSPNPLLHVFA